MNATFPELDCSVPGCDRIVTHAARYVGRRQYRGPGVPLCQRHYSRWRVYGDTAERPRSGPTHGLISTYNAGCHCDACRDASRIHRARMRSAHRTEGLFGCHFCWDRFATSRALYQHENKHTRDVNGRISA